MIEVVAHVFTPKILVEQIGIQGAFVGYSKRIANKVVPQEFIAVAGTEEFDRPTVIDKIIFFDIDAGRAVGADSDGIFFKSIVLNFGIVYLL